MIANIRDKMRQIFKDVSVRGSVAAAGTSILPVITGQAKYTIYVQRVWVHITTDAAQSLTVRDTASTPLVLLVIPASPGTGPQVFEFPDEGFPLTEGKNLDLVLSAAGLAFNYAIDAYLKPTATRSITEI